MALFHVERQPWQRWPRTLIVVRKADGAGNDERRRYVPERTCTVERSYYDDLLDEDYTDLSCGHYALGAAREFGYCPKCGARVIGG